ncbi:hypothetical protein A9179_00820 [Pseudomonas alcaligenes]|uniref:Hint domain-containing protein n=2 Tax=Aquipseudomonas alcaligenes TaxID=43263 RepID=A0ABR7RWU6_AQUAC|nr:hypothetical protein [Pseudomonas alcaligenes]
MFTALPAFGANPVGVVAKAALLSRLEGATPGKHTQPWPRSAGPSFRDIFFPGYTPAAYTDNVSGSTGLNDDFWSGFAVATLCQAMYNITSSLRKQLKSGDIDNAVNNCNAQITSSALPLYAVALQQGYAPFTQAYNDCPDKPQALAAYSAQLQSSNYLNALAVQYHGQGGLPNFDWLLWHHWVKLSILGSPSSSINGIIASVKSSLASLQVPLPGNVDAGTWLTYNSWMSTTDPGRRRLDWNDIAGAARAGILERVCTYYPGARSMSCMDEENSYEFTANGQPGTGYRDTGGGGCCFAAGTGVLLADGSERPIETLQPGAQLATTAGPRRLALVARPWRAGRALYRLDELPIAVTATHPFLRFPQAGQPALCSIDPLLLNARIPGLAALGIAPLGAGSPLLRLTADGSPQAYPLRQLQPLEGSGSADEQLYDLLLEPGPEPAGYLVGGAGTYLAVSAEMPDIGAHADIAPGFLALTQSLYHELHNDIAGLHQDELAPLLERLAVQLGQQLLGSALQQVRQRPPALRQSNLANADAHSATSAFFDLLARPHGPNLRSSAQPSDFNWQLNLLTEQLLGNLGDTLLAQLALGWREAGSAEGDTLAISLFEVSLLNGQAFAAAPLELQLSLGEQRHVLEESRQRPSGPFSRAIDQVLYCPLADNGELAEQLSLACQDGTGQTLRAQIYLPPRLDTGWRACEGLLRDHRDQVAGICRLDLRLLSSAAIEREQQRRQHWDQAQAEHYLNNLLQAVLQALPAQLQEFRAHQAERQAGPDSAIPT